MNEKLRSIANDWWRLLPTGDERKQATWFHKTMMRPQKSRWARTKRGSK